jgi:hypothetical protein
MTKRPVAAIACFGAVAGLALLARTLIQKHSVAVHAESEMARSIDHEHAGPQSLASETQDAARPELTSRTFVVRRASQVSLSAAGQCSRGQVHASFAANVPFRSLSTTVTDVRVSGRIPRSFEFFVDAVRGDVIEGHFSPGDKCTLRLVSPRGPADYLPLNPGIA